MCKSFLLLLLLLFFLCQTDEHKHEMDPIAQFVEHKAG